MQKHKIELRKLQSNAQRTEKKQRVRTKERAKQAKERVRHLAEVTEANKAIAFLKAGDESYQFGENLLTLKNYKEPLKQIPREEGIGWYGTLAADVKTGKVQCHLCGQFLEALPGHIWNTHKMKIREYREKFGLAYGTALVSEEQRWKLKQCTLDWLKSMTPEEKEEHLQSSRERLKAMRIKRGNKQPKGTMEQMNKKGNCPDQTLQQIIDLKNEIGHVPTKREFIELKGSQRFVHLVYKHFGSWTKAIEMCNFDKGDFPERINKGAKIPRYSDDTLLEYLRIYAEEYQQIPTASDWKRDLLPSHDTYVERFGTIENARQLAGVYNIVNISDSMLKRSKHYRKIYKDSVKDMV